MRRWVREHLSQRMVRPIIYKTLSRFLCALALALLWNRFVNSVGLVPISHAYTVFGVFFFALAWIDYLRLDGIRLPLANWFPMSAKRRPRGAYGDITDHLDQEIVPFEELTEEERHTCSLLTNIICAIILLSLSLV